MKKIRQDLGLHDSFEMEEDPYFKWENSELNLNQRLNYSAPKRIESER